MAPLLGLGSVLNVFNYAFRGVSVSTDMWDIRCICSILPLSLEIFKKNKPTGIVISRKPQSALKLPGSWNCFLALTQLF